MATHSSTLAWKISRTEEPGRLQSMVVELDQTELTEHSNVITNVPKRGIKKKRIWDIET